MVFKQVRDKLFNNPRLSSSVKTLLYIYTFLFVEVFGLFILNIGLSYLSDNIFISGAVVGVVLFVAQYLVRLCLYLGLIAVVFITISTSFILFFLTLITKILRKNNQSFSEIILMRLEEIVTLKKYWIVYIILILVTIILADSNIIDLRGLF